MTNNNNSLGLLYIEEVQKKGFVLYSKNGELKLKKTPDFGTITLSYQNGKCVLVKTEETEK